MMNKASKGSPDFILFFLTFVLVCFGLAMVFSASSMATSFTKGDPWFFTSKQVISVIIGTIGMIVVMNIPYMLLKKLAFIGYIFVVFTLFLLLFVAESTNGSKSWFYMGSFGIQPAELAKLSVILLLATIISNKNDKFRDFKTGLLPAIIVTSIVFGLILFQPDLGSALMILLCAFIVILVGGSNLKHIMAIILLLVIFLIVLLSVFFLNSTADEMDYRLERLTTFMNPWASQLDSGYQLVQSLLAFGHGGFVGTGFGRGVQKLHYLPEAHNDFIFAIIGEELGFIGVTIFLCVYLLFIWRGIIVSLRSKHTFGMLVGSGIMGMIGCQAFINIGGVTSAIPLTGVTLPLISYGGTSMLVTLVSMGIVLNISREQHLPSPDQS
jgi:cell division protein FtsW